MNATFDRWSFRDAAEIARTYIKHGFGICVLMTKECVRRYRLAILDAYPDVCKPTRAALSRNVLDIEDIIDPDYAVEFMGYAIEELEGDGARLEITTCLPNFHYEMTLE